MSDGQGEQLEQPALLSVAEVLTEHAADVRRAAFGKWAAPSPIPEGFGPWLRELVGDAHEAGWRAALEWYIATVHGPQLEELLETARQLGAAGLADSRRPT